MQLEKHMGAKFNAQEVKQCILQTRLKVIQYARALWFLENALVTGKTPLPED